MLLIWAFYESKAIAYPQKIIVLFTERNRLPTYSGIYAIADANNRLWYVGQAINLFRPELNGCKDELPIVGFTS